MCAKSCRKKSFKDRRDGKYVKAPSLNEITSCLYPNRCDNETMVTMNIDITNLMNYIDKKNSENKDLNIKFFHCFITAFARVLTERRKLNYFVRGGRTFERNKLTLSFVAKKQFTDNGGETLLTYTVKKNDSLEQVSKFILGEVKSVKDDNQINHIDKTLDFFAALPRIIRYFVGIVLRFMDFFGLVPDIITEGDPSYSTVLVANLGSIGIPSVYHHLNNYGTTSLMSTIGVIHKENVLNDDGSYSERTFIDVSVTADERIADGFYFSKSMVLLRKVLENPELLEVPFKERINLEEL